MKRSGRNVAALAFPWMPLGLLSWHVATYPRPYEPGRWMGDLGWFGVNPSILMAAIATGFFACALLISTRKYIWSVAFVAAFAGIASLTPSLSQPPEPRIRAEREAYRKAVQTGIKFGDQTSAVSDGRNLTYWRWMSWDDNGVGIIHDPEDRLDADNPEDARAFGDQLWRVRRLEPQWYFVEHT